jgi:S1-C subfamily serine protease
MKAPGAVLLLAVLAACARPEAAPAPEPASAAAEDSVVPGTIGVLVRPGPSGVVVTAVGESGPAARSGVRVGDLVVRYNGEPISSPRQFYRLMVDSRPGSIARLELRREGAVRTLDVPVEQLDTMPRV